MVPAAVLFLWLAVSTMRQATEGVAWSLGIYFALVIPGIGGAILQVLAEEPASLAVAKSMMFICRAGIPVALIALVLDMLGRPLSGRVLLLLTIVPMITITLALSNSVHGWVWHTDLATPDGQLIVQPSWGVWYRFVHAPYSYTLLGAMMVLFFMRLSAVSAPQRRILLLFLAISVGPMLSGLLYSFGIGTERLWLPAFSISLTAPIFLLILRDLRQSRFRPVSYRELIEQIRDPVIGLDNVGRVVSINQAACELIGRRARDLLGRRLPREQAFAAKMLAAENQSEPFRYSGHYFDARFSDVLSSGDQARGRTIVCRDVTAENLAREQLATSEQLMRTMVEQSSNGIVRLHRLSAIDAAEPVYNCVFANQAAGSLAGAEPEKLAGMDARTLLGMLLADYTGSDRNDLVDFILSSAASGMPVDKELELRPREGNRWIRFVAEPVDDDVAVTITDITAAMRRQLAIERRASHDHLTGLLNRHGFAEAADKIIANQLRGNLFFIDLNGFKQINDTLGHQTGDVLLHRVASRISHACRPQDVVGRLGGDEFVVLAGGLNHSAEDNLAERLIEALSQPYQIGDESVSCNAAVGRARFPEHGASVEELLHWADEAMYRAKRRTNHGESAIEDADA